MNSNKKDNYGWILCPSKSFPGKFYYFNVINGEAAWSLNDADQKALRKDDVLQKADKSHSYPEPSSPPTVSPTTNIGTIHQTLSNKTRWNVPNIPPTFGQATFPTYISNVDPYMQNVIWTPVQLPMFAKPRRDQVTQTWEPDRQIFVQACNIPLSKRFINYEGTNTSIFSQIAQCNQNKINQLTSTTNSFERQIGKPMNTSQIFGQTSQSQNENDRSIYKTTNIFFNDKSNKLMTNSHIFDPRDRFQSNDKIKKVERQRTQSESDKKIENMLYDYQNYGVTSTQMLEQAHCSTSTKEHFSRQRTQSESDSIIFENPNNFDNLKSTLITSNKGHNAIQQNTITSKTEDQTKRSFVLRNSVFNPNNKVHSTSSQMKNTGQIEKEVRKDSLWYKQDRNFFEENKKGSLVGSQEKYNKHGKEMGDLLDKLDKDDLRYTLEIKRRKSGDMGVLSHPEGNKLKTHKLNVKQTETPKKRVTFDLDSETSVEEREGCRENPPQYVNIHTLRQLANHVAGYWYIVVDAHVLVEDFEFMEKFVQLDGQCKLLIPHAVQSEIESFCFGDCRGRQSVIVARQLIRKLATLPPHVVVQPIYNEDEVFKNLSTLGRVLNCCLQIIEQNGHVVLITDDSILYEKAKSLKIHCYKLKEIKDGASRPKILISKPIKVTLKSDAIENLFLQKDFLPTWKIPNVTSKNLLKNCDVQTDMPPTMDANTSPINFEETLVKNYGKSNDYLNFDYDSNSDVTYMSKTMKELFIKDNNSNFVLKKSSTKNTRMLDDIERNSFTFQIKNENTLQKQNAKSNQSQNLKEEKSNQSQNFKQEKSNQLQNSKEKSDITQNSKHESIFSVPNDPLKNIKFQIQNKMPEKEIEIDNKNLSNNTNRRLMQLKFRTVIQEQLKNRFQVTSALMKENIRSNIEEWICTFLQVMENALSGLLQASNLSSLSLPPPWTLHETVTCVKQVYNEMWTVCVVADELSLLLLNNSSKQGQLRRSMKPEDFMRVFGCGVMLLENLQATEQMPEDIAEAQQLLGNMLLTLQNGKEDMDLVRSPVPTRSDDEEEPKRHNFMKKPSEVLQYLKKHFPTWQCDDESPTNPTLANDEVVTQNNETKIVRTCGRNLGLLTIDKTKSMTLNAQENPAINNQNEKNSQSADNKDNTERNISPITLLSSDDTEKLFENSEGSKVFKLSHVATPNHKNNKDDDGPNLMKQNEDTENVSQNTTDSTVKLYEEPRIVRIFDPSTPFSAKKTSKDANRDPILLSPKHGNTFDSQDETAGPKVVRNIKLIDAFEEKLKFKVDMDKLDYSVTEETLSNASNISQSAFIDGNDSNNDKISLNNQNNDTDYQNNRSNANDKNFLNKQKDYTDNQNDDESNMSTNDVLFNDDRNNDIQNNDLLKPNDSSTNDSGFVNENDTYTLVQTFLSELSCSMKLIYKFIEDSMKEFRNRNLQSEKKQKILDKATTTHGHLSGIIYKLQRIVQREADAVTPLKEVILKADVVVVSDKRMMRYRQVVIKCLEQAQMLEIALRQLRSIADGDYDVTFCSDNSVYFNIFE